jgi:hypothetical protein
MSIAYARWTQYKRHCPHCGGHFQTVFDPVAVRLGPGSRICGQCGKNFSDESIKWHDMTGTQQRKFLFGDLPKAGAIGVWVSALFMFVAVLNGHPELGFLFMGVVFGLGLVILAVYYLICWLDIRRSKRRSGVR